MNKHRNISRFLLILVLGGLLAAGSVFAQGRPPRDGGHQQRGGGGSPALPDSAQITRMVDEMASALSLSEKQKAAVSDLHFSHFAKAEELMEKHEGDRESHRESMESLRKDFDEETKALLNDEQKAKYDEFMKDRDPRRGQQQPGRQ